MLGRFKISILIVALVFMGVLAWLHLTPAPHYRDEVAKILQARQGEWEAAQKAYANDPVRNLYLDPTFGEMWKLPTEAKSPDGAVNQTVTVFSECNPINNNGRTLNDLNQVLAEQHLDKKKFIALRKQFQVLAAKLQEAVHKPVFLPPSAGDFSLKNPGINVVGLRRLVQALAFEGLLETHEKHPDPGAQKALLAEQLAYRFVDGSRTLTDLMMGVALQSVGYDALVDILRGSRLRKETLERVVVELGQEVPSQAALGVVLEYELLSAHNTLFAGPDRLLTTNDGWKTRAQTYLASWSGWLGREMRFYDNDMVPRIQAAYQPDAQAHLDEKPNGTVSAALIRDFSRAAAVLEMDRSKAAGLRLMAALELYRLKKSKYPPTLDLLKEVGLGSLPVDELSSKPFAYSLKDGKPSLQMPVDDKVAEASGLKLQAPNRRFPYRDGSIQLLP